MIKIGDYVKHPELMVDYVAVVSLLAIFATFSKKIINANSSGLLRIVLTEIVSSFMFICAIWEKGLWFENVNETYFHFATAAQVIYFTHFMPGKANPLPILAEHGLAKMLLVFPFQILGALGGARFMQEVYWKIGFLPFHSTISSGKCTPTLGIDQQTGIAIETALVFLMIIAPEIEKALAKTLKLDQDNTVMLSQAVLVAYVVKTFIRSTGAIMNPLLSILINFHCISTPQDLLQHATTYWAGPIAITMIMGFFAKRDSSKKKTD
ncbi:Oidioi.mRNA.OKI2018_I69.chr1.g1277.t2.cds [Oikopleura dioica]|uniref:Oidioi.mRNA.OKI2018_I69.chr1.g1277.t2.cds n=1 Tax=Oikopleura dioica TaxID=34765 RepID=A0ABN7STS2_OIKDI|nr:Oidioi.mRNA.OKI2018_I69.chr1.g1277.t2.cds [Oikopleura dioica]